MIIVYNIVIIICKNNIDDDDDDDGFLVCLFANVFLTVYSITYMYQCAHRLWYRFHRQMIRFFSFALWFITNLIKMRLHSINTLEPWNFNLKWLQLIYSFEFQITHKICIKLKLHCHSAHSTCGNRRKIDRNYIIISVLIQMMDASQWIGMDRNRWTMHNNKRIAHLFLFSTFFFFYLTIFINPFTIWTLRSVNKVKNPFFNTFFLSHGQNEKKDCSHFG